MLELPSINPYLNIDVIFQSMFIFLLIKRYGDRLQLLKGVISFLAPLTFGVYLIHGLILKYITFPLVYDLWGITPVLAVPICALVTFSIGIFVVFLFSKLPKHKYIIG